MLLTVLVALGACPAAAAETPTSPGPSSAAETRLDCAVITSQHYNPVLDSWRATVPNDCGRNIYASVQVDFIWDPKCAWISNGRSHQFSWGGLPNSKPNYVYAC
ncbi:hypothetical protein ACIGPN_27895 [Streptomyces afghaniensis]|uniref:hypothetical protein n=1 Tax=Streptomyces afghaniensis TaxID=66865 RepID=UPI0037D8203B